jgi:putative transposase
MSGSVFDPKRAKSVPATLSRPATSSRPTLSSSRSRLRFGESPFAHFLTCAVVSWLPVFTRPETVQISFDSWQFPHDQGRLRLLEYVVLENHIHFIAKARHKGDRAFPLWQEGSHRKAIENEEVLRKTLESIHKSPVKRG